jgi:hypothetical protein
MSLSFLSIPLLIALAALGFVAFIRPRAWGMAAALWGVACCFLSAGPAAAGVDLTPVVSYGVELLFGGILLPVLGWAARRLSQSLRISDDDQVRRYLEQALLNALEFARELALQQGGNLADVQVRNRLVEDAANYVMPRVPDALKRFGIEPDGLREMLTARLGSVAAISSLPSSSTGR